MCLPTEKVFRIKERCSRLACSATMSIQELAEFIGLLVSSFPDVLHGPLFYRHLEHDKTMGLSQNKGNYQARIKLSQESLEELQWWCNNIETAEYSICTPNSKIDVTLYTDASNKGWGAVMGEEKTGGRWTETESNNHINCLELMAVFLGLKALYINITSVHICIYSDNTTTVNYINSMGGTHSVECKSVAKEIGCSVFRERSGFLQLISQGRTIFRQTESLGFLLTIWNGCSGKTFFKTLQKFWGNPL